MNDHYQREFIFRDLRSHSFDFHHKIVSKVDESWTQFSGIFSHFQKLFHGKNKKFFTLPSSSFVFFSSPIFCVLNSFLVHMPRSSYLKKNFCRNFCGLWMAEKNGRKLFMKNSKLKSSNEEKINSKYNQRWYHSHELSWKFSDLLCLGMWIPKTEFLFHLSWSHADNLESLLLSFIRNNYPKYLHGKAMQIIDDTRAKNSKVNKQKSSDEWKFPWWERKIYIFFSWKIL